MLPLLYPSLGGAALLTFMTALASFSAPYIFGGGFRVMPTQIVATRLNGDDRLAMVETSSLTLLALRHSGCFAEPARDGSAGGRKGAAPRLPIRSRSPRLLLAVVGWGLAAAPAAAAPDTAAGVVRAGGHLDHRAASPGVHLGQLSHIGPGSGAGPAAR